MPTLQPVMCAMAMYQSDKANHQRIKVCMIVYADFFDGRASRMKHFRQFSQPPVLLISTSKSTEGIEKQQLRLQCSLTSGKIIVTTLVRQKLITANFLLFSSLDLAKNVLYRIKEATFPPISCNNRILTESNSC